MSKKVAFDAVCAVSLLWQRGTSLVFPIRLSILRLNPGLAGCLGLAVHAFYSGSCEQPQTQDYSGTHQHCNNRAWHDC